MHMPRYLPMFHRRRVLCPWQRSSGGASPWGRACFRRGSALTTHGQLSVSSGQSNYKSTVERPHPNISGSHIHDFFESLGDKPLGLRGGTLRVRTCPQADPDGTESAEALGRDRKLFGQVSALRTMQVMQGNQGWHFLN